MKVLFPFARTLPNFLLFYIESHHSTRRNQQQEVQEEEEKTYPLSQGSEHKARTNTINSEILNSQEFFSMAENDPDKQHHKDDWGQCDIEAHRVYGYIYFSYMNMHLT